MKTKKTISMLAAAAMLGGAAPVFADPDVKTPAQVVFQRHAAAESPGVSDRGHFVKAHHQPRAYRGHPAYHGQRVYQAQPAYHGRPVYHGQPVYAEPAYHYDYGYPAYAGRPDNSAAIVGGAALGAMIGSQVGDRNSRPAAMAFGAIFGAILGSELSDR